MARNTLSSRNDEFAKPLYAIAGAGDLVVARLREAGEKVNELSNTIRTIPAVAAQNLKTIPSVARNVDVSDLVTEGADSVSSKVNDTYSELATRGEKLVSAIRGQKATEDLLEQAGNTETVAKGAATTARNNAKSTTAATKRARTTAKKADARKASAAKAARTTARKNTANTRSRVKATATSATKTAAAASDAVNDAAGKVGQE